MTSEILLIFVGGLSAAATGWGAWMSRQIVNLKIGTARLEERINAACGKLDKMNGHGR